MEQDNTVKLVSIPNDLLQFWYAHIQEIRANPIKCTEGPGFRDFCSLFEDDTDLHVFLSAVLSTLVGLTEFDRSIKVN